RAASSRLRRAARSRQAARRTPLLQTRKAAQSEPGSWPVWRVRLEHCGALIVLASPRGLEACPPGLAFHLPARGRIHKVDGTLGGGAQPIHQPDVVLARRGVPPQDVGFAEIVKASCRENVPSL